MSSFLTLHGVWDEQHTYSGWSCVLSHLHQGVVQLDVAVDDTHGVAILQTQQQLLEEPAGCWLREAPSCPDMAACVDQVSVCDSECEC
jgi:hypothetical protein